jgi:hypothetical protein
VEESTRIVSISTDTDGFVEVNVEVVVVRFLIELGSSIYGFNYYVMVWSPN